MDSLRDWEDSMGGGDPAFDNRTDEDLARFRAGNVGPNAPGYVRTDLQALSNSSDPNAARIASDALRQQEFYDNSPDFQRSPNLP